MLDICARATLTSCQEAEVCQPPHMPFALDTLRLAFKLLNFRPLSFPHGRVHDPGTKSFKLA